MVNKHKIHFRFVIIIILFLRITFCVSQNNEKIIFEKISRDKFISNSTEDKPYLINYTCRRCDFQIEYIRNQTFNNYHDSFSINKKLFDIDQLLEYAVGSYAGMDNKNRIRLQSAAQYGLTMFWKDVNISKPKEDTK